MFDKVVERWPLLFLAPGAELAVALLVIGVILVFAHSFVRDARADRAMVPPMLRLTAGVVMAAWLADVVVQALWVRPPSIAWWSFALPLVLAALGVGATALVVTRGVRRTGEPTLVGVRRSWWSFSSASALWASGVIAVLVLVTTVVSGSFSSPDEFGRYTFIDFGDAGTASFYGWSYGLPVLVGLPFLVVATLIVLGRVAAPPFVSPDSLSRERRARQVASHATLSLAAAALSLALGEALQLIGQAGSGGSGVGIPGVGEFSWSPGYSSFAGFFLWTGWAMEVVSLIMLLALIVGVVPLGLSARRSMNRRNENEEVWTR